MEERQPGKTKPLEGLVGKLLCPLTLPSIESPKSPQSHKFGVPESFWGREWELPLEQTHMHPLPILVIYLSREESET